MVAVLRTLNSPVQSPALAAQHLPPSRAASSSCLHTHSASVPMRHIRFAPLPEPTTQFDSSDAIMDTHSCMLSSNTVYVQRTPSKQKQKSSFSRQFNLFKRPSTDPLAQRPQPYDLGAPLSRSTSNAIRSNSQPRRFSTSPSLSSSKPHSSTNTIGSGGGRHPMPPNRFLSPSHPTSRPTAPTNGMHMLNGRAYGSKHKPLTNPFANVRDEPDFVEWGYGGMGSISCSSNSKYSVLAKDAPALLSHGHAQKVVVGSGRDGAARERKGGVGISDLVGGDDDDGSGMGWVRKRRQERERLARDKPALLVQSDGAARASMGK